MTPLARVAWKETGALAPMWIAAAVAVAAAPVWSAFRLDPVALAAYIVGSLALGAHVIGHEYAHRTLDILLAQPQRRTRILAVKLGVLAIAVLTLTAIASAGPYSPIVRFPERAALDSRVVFLPTLMGLTLAPYLALVARSTLGGAVFSIGLTGLLLISADLVGIQLYGVGSAGEIDRFKYTVFPVATIVACVAAAIALWPAFSRLETVGDGGGISLPLVTGGATAANRRSIRNPLWLLAAKEIRLQQMTFVVIALYVLAAAGAMWVQRALAVAEAMNFPWSSLNLLYAGLLALLVGALASAEERQLGTLEWQSLMPVAAWQQFAVKLAVVVGLTFVAGMVLPELMARLAPLPHLAGFPRRAFGMTSALVVAISIGSLYVSTLSSSGVRALATALPVLAAVVLIVRAVPMALWEAAQAGWLPRPVFMLGPREEIQAQVVLAAILACIAAIFLVHAYRNHAAVDRGLRRVAAQGASIVAVVVTAGVALFALGVR